MNAEKLMRMAGAVRTGGKGSVRRYVAAAFPKQMAVSQSSFSCSSHRSVPPLIPSDSPC